MQELRKRLQEHHVGCAEDVAKKSAADAASAATVSPDTTNVLEAMVQLEQARTRAKAAMVVMYLDTGESVRPSAPPDVSAVKGILSSYSFLFFDTPGHYVMRKYSCW